MAKKTPIAGTGIVKTNEAGTQYVYDPTTQKSYTPTSAKGIYLTGGDPTKAEVKGASDKSILTSTKTVSTTERETPPEGKQWVKQPNGEYKLFDIPGGTQLSSGAPGYTGGKTEETVTPPETVTFEESISQMSKSYQETFKNLQELLGEQSDMFAKQMEKIQKQTGQIVDIESPEFQKQVQELAQKTPEGKEPPYTQIMGNYLKGVETTGEDVIKAKDEAIAAGVDEKAITDVMRDFQAGVVTPYQATEFLRQKSSEGATEPAVEEETVPSPDKNANAGYTVDIAPTSSPTDQAADTMENITGMSGTGIADMLKAAGYDLSTMTGAEALQVMLLQYGINQADDPTVNDYLTRMYESAQSSYLSTIAQVDVTIEEIDKIMSGEDIVPTTYESLAAKIYKQQGERALESIELEKDWLTDQYDYWMQDEQSKRGRLEGYLKAKLYAAGAQDSSAGLATMALAVNAADLRIQLKASEYQYSMGKLNLEARGIMEDFTNNVVGLAMQAESKKGEAATKYEDRVFEIEGLMIENEKEKNKLKLDAMSKFTDNMYKIEQDMQAQAKWEYEQQYKAMQDSIDQAYKLSGLTGTVYYVGEDGALVDSGIPTLDTKKWEASNMLDVLNYNRNIDNDSWDKAMDLLDGGMDTAAAQILGLDDNFFASYTTDAEKKQALNDLKNDQALTKSILDQLAGENGVISVLYKEGAWGGQCGEFIHNFITNYPYGLDTLNQKMSVINSNIPKVGEVVILSEGGNTGHVALINKIDVEKDKDGNIIGGTLTLTESNYHNDEKVTNTREIPYDYSKIMGYFDGSLDPAIQDWTDSQNPTTTDTYTFSKSDFEGNLFVPNYLMNILDGMTVKTGGATEEATEESTTNVFGNEIGGGDTGTEGYEDLLPDV